MEPSIYRLEIRVTASEYVEFIELINSKLKLGKQCVEIITLNLIRIKWDSSYGNGWVMKPPVITMSSIDNDPDIEAFITTWLCTSLK